MDIQIVNKRKCYIVPDLHSTCATLSQLFILAFQNVPNEQIILVQWQAALFQAKQWS